MDFTLVKTVSPQKDLQELEGREESSDLVFESHHRNVEDILVGCDLYFRKLKIYIEWEGSFRFLMGCSYDALLALSVYSIKDFDGRFFSLRSLVSLPFKKRFKIVIEGPSKVKIPRVWVLNN